MIFFTSLLCVCCSFTFCSRHSLHVCIKSALFEFPKDTRNSWTSLPGLLPWNLPPRASGLPYSSVMGAREFFWIITLTPSVCHHSGLLLSSRYIPLSLSLPSSVTQCTWYRLFFFVKSAYTESRRGVSMARLDQTARKCVCSKVLGIHTLVSIWPLITRHQAVLVCSCK